MIKIQAEEHNGVVDFKCDLRGEGIGIVIEAVAIVLELPLRIEAESPELFDTFVRAYERISKQYDKIKRISSDEIKGGLA